MKQNGASVVDYFTTLSSILEELDSMNLLPPLTTVSEETSKFSKALNAQIEQSKLFYLLNGLNDTFF